MPINAVSQLIMQILDNLTLLFYIKFSIKIIYFLQCILKVTN